MRLILQRVTRAAVTIDGGDRREIGPGLMILVGVTGTDDAAVGAYMADKAVNLRIFEDDDGNMNRSLLDVGGSCLVVSQFTLYANSRKGRRPSFIDAAKPDQSEPLYRDFVRRIGDMVPDVKTGEFGAEMLVEIHNDGPVTIILDSAEIMPQKATT